MLAAVSAEETGGSQERAVTRSWGQITLWSARPQRSSQIRAQSV